MVKKMIALALAAAMAVSGMTALARNDENLYFETVMTDNISLFKTDVEERAELLDSRQLELYNKLSAAIEAQQVQGEKCTVTVDGLETLGLDCELVVSKDENDNPIKDENNEDVYELSEDSKMIFGVISMLVQSGRNYNMRIYNIISVKGKMNKEYILSEITFEIDNTPTIDNIVSTVIQSARERLNNEEMYNQNNYECEKYPIAFFLENSTELLSKIQAAVPELCYVQPDIGADARMGYWQNNDSFSVDIAHKITFRYLPITLKEYKAFANKLDEIISEVICPEMTDAQKAMALHDWIIDNVDYGYKLNRYIWDSSASSSDAANIIYNIEEFDKLMGMVDEESQNVMSGYKRMAHTAYGPAMLGYGVCQGYTMLYSALLNKVGIENGTVVSPAMNHQWSTIKLDGEWYHTDVTWDDPLPGQNNAEDYKKIELSTSGGDTIDLRYQINSFHTYDNFLCSGETFGKNDHITDGACVIPEAEFTDDKYHARDNAQNSDTAYYVFDRISSEKLYYGRTDGMYYYEQRVKHISPVPDEPDRIVTEYYKLPFSLKSADGTFAEPVQVTKEAFDKAVSGAVDYVTVTVPDEDIINNSVAVEYKFEGEENEELSVENIGTAVITVKAAEITEPSDAVASVDAYLVYYGENNTVKAVVKKTVQLAENGEISFDASMPEGAVAAKIIILDADKDLQPVIKAIGVQTVPAEPEQPAA